MKDESAKFRIEQAGARVRSLMNSIGKPLCECGKLAMIGSKYCSDCLPKVLKQLSKAVN